METSSNLIFQIDSYCPKGKRIPFGELVKKFSEEASLYPDPSFLPEFWCKDSLLFKKPSTCKSLLLALVYSRPGWSCNELYENLLQHLYHICRNHNFQGEWYTVGEILQQDLFTSGIYGILKKVIQNLSEEDFFGNIMPTTYRIFEKRLIVVRNQVSKKTEILSKRDRLRGIPRKIRRRGYNDKGSTRPLHERHEPGPDFTLDQKEQELQEIRSQLGPPKDPPSRYWYRSLDYGVGPTGSQRNKNSRR